MIAIITQARVNSNRLPNKIFKEASNTPYLKHHIERLRRTGLPIIVATTNDGSEQPIVEFCIKENLDYFKGDEQNVLQRFYQCAKQFQLKNIIRVTSDCPLIDPAIITTGVQEYIKRVGETYYSNALQRSYPRGMDYEIFSFNSLQEAFESATEHTDLEHVTPYIWKNKSGKINVVNDVCTTDNSNFRITLDTTEDDHLIKKLIENYDASLLSCSEIVAVLRNHPELVAINAAIEQKKL